MENPNKDKILARLLILYKDELSPTKMAEIRRIAKTLSSYSIKHHYIPQFYIKGFTGDDKLLNVYNKVEDRIEKRRISPKSIFFEEFRNTVMLEDISISIIEDIFYSHIDSNMAKLINFISSNPHDEVLNDFRTELIHYFIIDLFWRNPITDDAFADLFRRSKIKITNHQTGIEIRDFQKEMEYKLDPFNMKSQRARMGIETINNILKDKKVLNGFHKLWTFEDDNFVLGDNPFLFEKTPTTFSDLRGLSVFFPITSKIMFSFNKKTGLSFEANDGYIFNALIINQSNKYVCSPSFPLLEASVATYKKIKSDGFLAPCKNYLFVKTSF